MSNDTGGPAFPQPLIELRGGGGFTNPSDGYGLGGMTLRDYFAANALLGLIAEPIEGVQQCVAFELSDHTTQMFADAAYKFADAMLKARDK